jgi:hypothetical protein
MKMQFLEDLEAEACRGPWTYDKLSQTIKYKNTVVAMNVNEQNGNFIIAARNTLPNLFKATDLYRSFSNKWEEL